MYVYFIENTAKFKQFITDENLKFYGYYRNNKCGKKKKLGIVWLADQNNATFSDFYISQYK